MSAREHHAVASVGLRAKEPNPNRRPWTPGKHSSASATPWQTTALRGKKLQRQVLRIQTLSLDRRHKVTTISANRPANDSSDTGHQAMLECHTATMWMLRGEKYILGKQTQTCMRWAGGGLPSGIAAPSAANRRLRSSCAISGCSRAATQACCSAAGTSSCMGQAITPPRRMRMHMMIDTYKSQRTQG